MSPEYVTDVAYVRNFEADLGPPRLRLVAAVNGFAPPSASEFTYCELGCAHADTLVAIAAANPRARFVGVDFNAEHIAHARGLAVEGEVDNVHLLDLDFEALLGEDLGPFDLIVAHGVLSWVSPHKRKAVIDFASARLKPGGLLYVSYNAMPGWAAVEPLRQLLVGAAAPEQASLERAGRGLALAKQLSEQSAEYFVQNPPARAMLETIEKLGLAYLVHEYLHAHWQPMYFGQVAQEMAASDLYFVGVQPLYANFRDLAVPASTWPSFEGITDRIAFESLKDFALNEYFRRDVYVKGAPVRADAVTGAYLDATAFGAAGALPGARDVTLRHHTMHFEGPVFDALFEVLGEGAQTGRALLARPELAGFGAEKVRAALLRMVIGAHAAPMQAPTRTRSVDASRRLQVPLAYNRMVLRQPVASDSPIVLASPVAGTGISVPVLSAMAIRALTEANAAERPAWIEALIGGAHVKLQIGGRLVESGQERVRIVHDELQAFARESLPRFVELGILSAAPQ